MDPIFENKNFSHETFMQQIRAAETRTKQILDQVDLDVMDGDAAAIAINKIWIDMINQFRYPGEIKYFPANTGTIAGEQTKILNQ